MLSVAFNSKPIAYNRTIDDRKILLGTIEETGDFEIINPDTEEFIYTNF